MRPRGLAVAAAVLLAASAGGVVRAAPPPVVIVIKAARLIDGRGGAPLVPAMVRVNGDRIAEVGPRVAIPAGARRHPPRRAVAALTAVPAAKGVSS
jgi:hypothetical protein